MQIAHFLNTANLKQSPPNNALALSFANHQATVDYFAPDTDAERDISPVAYGFKWLAKNIWKLHWRKYSAFSCTSEDPIVVAGLLSFIWRRPLIFISDEIKSGSYVGDRSRLWKYVCRWAMRRASITMVNDQSRIRLQREYASLSGQQNVLVYPGCFVSPPPAADGNALRTKWGVQHEQCLIGFSGGCNLTAGIDLALECLEVQPDCKMLVQPLALTELDDYLLRNHKVAGQCVFSESRLTWQEAWSSMGAVDVGVAIYKNPAPQFQNMGISSNRLCMFLAMGVPVIVSRQPSFQFIEDYECGFMVDNAKEFNEALERIKANIERMKANALRCSLEYIDAAGKHKKLSAAVSELLSR